MADKEALNFPAPRVNELTEAKTQWEKLQAIHNDPVNLTIGLINDSKDDPLAVWRPATINEALAAAELEIAENKNFGYQPDQGYQGFLDELGKFTFGNEQYVSAQEDKDIQGYQTTGGTEAVKFIRDIIKVVHPADPVSGKIPIIVDPGWSAKDIFGEKFAAESYNHLAVDGISYNHKAFMELIDNAKPNTPVFLQACGYNPDGLDRTKEQWDEIFERIEERDLIPLIDAAYLGLAEGIHQDRYPLEKCLQSKKLSFICVSTSKNMGLYNHRLGAAFILNAKTDLKDREEALLLNASGSIRTSPPLQAAMAVSMVLGDSTTNQAFYDELERIRHDIASKRRLFGDLFNDLSSLDHPIAERQNVLLQKSRYAALAQRVMKGSGLFTLGIPGGLDYEQRRVLYKDGINIAESSRINIASIPQAKLDRVVTALKKVI